MRVESPKLYPFQVKTITIYNYTSFVTADMNTDMKVYIGVRKSFCEIFVGRKIKDTMA
jgi:hypothetical protein